MTPTETAKRSSRPRRVKHNVAVIIIHGIGEQKPMETLRGFADAVLPEPQAGGERYFSKPDPLSELFELRRLQNRNWPQVHLFEYYWAYKVEGTKIGDILGWMKTLLLRSPGKVPGQLLPLWVISWLLAVTAVGTAGLGWFGRVASATVNSPTAWVSLVSAALFAAIQWFVVYYIGDAARYLSPTPHNIKLRHDIRADGIQLLRKIQKEGKYHRVIMVGHSLGSVVAYDILRHVWQECKEVYLQPKKSSQPALQRLEELGEALRSGSLGGNLPAYMDAQVNLWKELRQLGYPWLVTDLITMGSPLAHAAMLLASDEENLRLRQRQRELPTNPPVTEVDADSGRTVYSYEVWTKYGEKKDIPLRSLHDAALFACTRWTNLYFPAALNVFGDIVGGPLQKVFGAGIRDVRVDTGRGLSDKTLLAHTSYWSQTSASRAGKGSSRPSLEALIQALDLNNESYYGPPTEPAAAKAGAKE